MKKIIFQILFIILVFNSYSQVIVSLTAVPCNSGLEGLYPFTYAGELDGSSTDWGCPNMYDVNNTVSGPLEMINDSASGTAIGIGTPPLNNVPKSALGCDTLGNLAQDLTGKIAVIYRGICNFSLKALNAQKRGAIGVIIINHTGDPITMAGGSYGTRVTIPVVMISRVVGDDLFFALQNCPTDSVKGSIGYLTNNMATSKADCLMPENNTTPKNLAPNGTIFPLDLGFFAYNLGSNPQNGVTASVTVSLNSSVIYSQTSLPLNFNAPIGSNVDTQFIDLGTYAPPYWGSGIYSVAYSLNNVDDDISDNSINYDFRITDSINRFYAKSRTDNSSNPLYTNSYSFDTNSTEWEVCLNLKMRNYALSFESVKIVVSSINSNSTEVIDLKVYKWNDTILNLNSPPTFNSLVLTDSTQYVLTNLYQIERVETIGFYWSTNMNQRYLFCVSSNSSNLKLGFDEELNYKATANHFQEPVSPIRMKLTNGVDNWDFKGLGYGIIPSISLDLTHIDFEPCPPCVSVEEEKNIISHLPYPNPANNLLTIPLRNGVVGNIKIEVFDLTGKLVLSEIKTIGNEALKINVASISNGAYMFKLTFANGTTDQYKISVNR